MSDLRQEALDYHAQPVPGKIAIALTKPAETARDLALAYSPGVAEPVREIARDPELAYQYTGKGSRPRPELAARHVLVAGLGKFGCAGQIGSAQRKEECGTNGVKPHVGASATVAHRRRHRYAAPSNWLQNRGHTGTREHLQRKRAATRSYQ